MAVAEELNRKDFIITGAVLAAAAATLPWRSAAAEEDEGSQNWKYEKGRYWVADLGPTSDYGSATPCLVQALFMNNKCEVMDKARVFIRWYREGDKGQRWTAISAICTHLKCELEFNSDKNRYVCPCHHSEFALDGEVKRKPAHYDLKDYSDLLIVEKNNLYLRRVARVKRKFEWIP